MRGGRSLDNLHRISTGDSDGQLSLGEPGTYVSNMYQLYNVPICTYMYLYVPICTYMYLYVTICTYMYLYVPICTYM